MKKAIFIGILLVLFTIVSAISFGQESGAVKRPAVYKAVKSVEMKKCQKCGMMKMMMTKAMVATQDGGVVVLAGKKLLKYDKDLNLVKEVKIDIAMEGEKEMMMQKKAKHLTPEPTHN